MAPINDDETITNIGKIFMCDVAKWIELFEDINEAIAMFK